MILPGDSEVLVPRLGLHCLVQTQIIQGALDSNFMLEPGAGNILQKRLLLLPLPTGFLCFVVHLQQGGELTQVEVEVLDKVIQIWGLVLHGLPNYLQKIKVYWKIGPFSVMGVIFSISPPEIKYLFKGPYRNKKDSLGEHRAMSAINVSAQFLYFERDKVNTDLRHPPGGKHALRLVVNSMNERVLTVGEQDQGEVVLGRQYGGRVVEDAVGVASLQAGSAIYDITGKD